MTEEQKHLYLQQCQEEVERLGWEIEKLERSRNAIRIGQMPFENKAQIIDLIDRELGNLFDKRYRYELQLRNKF